MPNLITDPFRVYKLKLQLFSINHYRYNTFTNIIANYTSS